MTNSETSQENKTTKLHGPAELTLDEIKMRRIVTSMKIKIEQQRLLTAVLPGATPVDSAVVNNISRMESFMQYATLAVTAFRMVKKTARFFKSFRN